MVHTRPGMLQLVGMLDSPYVRRVAVSLQWLGLEFEHRPLSVFSTFEQFGAINPVVKAPTLVCADGTVLLDSTLILGYLERLAPPDRSLLPSGEAELARCLRTVGLALAACEKSVQIIYERTLRPPERQHEPWLARVTGQLLAAYRMLEAEIDYLPLPVQGSRIDQAGVTAAVAWHFTQRMLPEVVPAVGHPRLEALSQAAERRVEFTAAPHGTGRCQTA